MDATYRADLRELNELNFAHFDAKLEQRLVAFSAHIELRIATFEARITRWMLVMWLGTLGTLIAVLKL